MIWRVNTMGREEMSLVAKKHVIKKENELGVEIRNSAKASTVFNGQADAIAALNSSVRTTPCEVILMDADSVTAAFAAGRGRTCILNFASYKHPGGGFLHGMMAQEEALCHVSNLFNILRMFDNVYYGANRAELNRGLYKHRALYTPSVIFDSVGGRTAAFDVLTCAAPNWSAAGRYGRVTREENDAVMHERIAFMLSSMANGNPDTIVLGAWGCGVFKQDPIKVATSMRYWLEKLNVGTRIILAIPGATSKNYKAFESVFAEVL